MGQGRLSSLALLAIERTLVKSLEKTHCSHAICASENTVTPSTPKKSVRVYIALRGSDSHEAYNRLQFFLGVGRIAYQIEMISMLLY